MQASQTSTILALTVLNAHNVRAYWAGKFMSRILIVPELIVATALLAQAENKEPRPTPVGSVRWRILSEKGGAE